MEGKLLTSGSEEAKVQLSSVVPNPSLSDTSHLYHWPKFNHKEIKVVYLRCTCGEVDATSALAAKISRWSLSPKKAGNDLAKATNDWKGLRIRVKLTIQNSQVQIEVPENSLEPLKRPWDCPICIDGTAPCVIIDDIDSGAVECPA
ncbi:hypothetical protein GH733_013605, partial [Mirounga leonina]